MPTPESGEEPHCAVTEMSEFLELTPMTGNKVYLKAFDVDDATDENFDRDDNHQVVIDTNGRKGDDNMDTTWLKTGQFRSGGQAKGAATDVVLDASGNATVVFETTMQPGDNFRVALAFKQEDLNSLQVDNPDGAGFVPSESDKQPNGFNGVVSPLLTVWRKLHVEEDTMAEVAIQGAEKNFETGVIDSVVPGAGGRFTLNLSIQLPGGNNRFENGKIFIDGWRYKVISSSHFLGFDDNVVVQDDDAGHLAALNAAAQAVGKTFQIFDDDDDQMPNDLKLPISSSLITDAVRSKFIPAYVEINNEIENQTKIIPFKLNREAPHPDAPDSTDSQGFWVRRVIAAYQPSIAEDGDPDSENDTGASQGMTNALSIDSLIYLETIRDGSRVGSGIVDENLLRNLLYGVVAHEIAHGPGSILRGPEADHLEGGLMRKGSGLISETFRAKTILRFRLTDRWN
jgi:hypothetical protein